MKKIVLVFTLMLTFSNVVVAQGVVVMGDKNIGHQEFLSTKDTSNGSSSSLSANTFVGSPLALSNQVENTVIKTTSGKMMKIPNGNYNAYTDQIVSQFKRDSIFSFNDNTIQYVLFDKVKAKKMQSYELGRRYFFVLEEGKKVSFMKTFTSKVVIGKENPMTKVKMTKDKVIVKTHYFYSKDGKSNEKFKLKKKTILKILEANKKEIMAYVKENKLGYSKEEDVKTIFNYYNSL